MCVVNRYSYINISTQCIFHSNCHKVIKSYLQLPEMIKRDSRYIILGVKERQGASFY